MGLAPYGRPIYRDLIQKQLIDIKPDGSFRLDMHYFNYCQGLTMTNGRFHDLFGGPPRNPESGLTQRHMDLAASIQAVTEEVLLRIARGPARADRADEPGAGRRRGAELRGQRPLVARGAVFVDLDSAGGRRRGRSARRGSVRLAPAPEPPREPEGRDAQRGSFLGPEFLERGSLRTPSKRGPVGRQFEAFDELCEYVAGLLADEQVVGWFQGRMEFGPRALGRGASWATRARQRCRRR